MTTLISNPRPLRSGLFIVVALFGTLTAAAFNCSSSAIPVPSLPLATVHHVTVNEVQNFSLSVPQNGAGPYFDTTYSGLAFCNVTIIYSYNDLASEYTTQTTIWLPLRGWNGRFQGTGGSGFSAGLGALGLAPAVANGFAAAETNGGHPEDDQSPATWALRDSKQVDLARLTTFAYTSVGDLATLGKAVIESFYGTPPKFSYWNGCSTGGRQGLALAQKYPTAFDGIAAISPATNWPSLTVSTYWPQQVMNRVQHYPRQCELAFITREAIKSCDEDDGLKDGIISLPDKCLFDANETVGKLIDCEGYQTRISAATASVANAAWRGNGLWYGLNRGTHLAGMANTTCSGPLGSECSGVPFAIEPWIPYFVEKDAEFAVANMTDNAYRAVFHKSVLQYQHVIGTANPDLSPFKASGGKMISTHGLADPAVFPNGTRQYYKSVLFFDANAADYYRYFEAPGIGHCGSIETDSFYPNDTLEALMKWVEHGEAPVTLTAVSQKDQVSTRPLCPFPKSQYYTANDMDGHASFECL